MGLLSCEPGSNLSLSEARGYRLIHDLKSAWRGREFKTLATEVEEALKRISSLKDVIGTMIVDNVGNILRSTIPEEEQAVKYANEIPSLALMTRSAIRELDPQNDLNMIRIKSLRHELIAVIDLQFTLIVIQQYPGFVPEELPPPPPEEVKPEEEEF
ncbi:unnamed protein product [Calypogeia fissa]